MTNVNKNEVLASMMTEATEIAFTTYLPLIAKVSSDQEIPPRLAITAMMIATVVLAHVEVTDSGEEPGTLNTILSELLSISTAAVPGVMAMMLAHAEARGDNPPAAVADLVGALKAA